MELPTCPNCGIKYHKTNVHSFMGDPKTVVETCPYCNFTLRDDSENVSRTDSSYLDYMFGVES